MRILSPSLLTLPSKTCATFKAFPISSMVTSLPLKEKEEVLPATFNPSKFAKVFKISSAMPSPK